MNIPTRERRSLWLRVVLLLATTAFAATAHAQGLKVILLGTGYADPRMDRFGLSILVEAGNEKLLFGCLLRRVVSSQSTVNS